MNEALLKLSEKAAEAIKTASEAPEFKEVMEKALEGDTGSFKVVISTEHPDRMQDVIKQDGWQLERYKANPIVLWGHDYKQLPIGVCTNLYVGEYEGKSALIAEGKFADHEFAQVIRKLYDSKIVRATSVGFIPKKFDEHDMSIITIAELLEFSFVSVPANPYALSTLSSEGYSQAEIGTLFAKSILNLNIKEGETIDEVIDETDPEEETLSEEPTEEKDAEEVPEEVEVENDETEASEDELEEVEDTPEEEKSLDEQIKAKKAELAEIEKKIEMFKKLDIATIKSIILALDSLIPTEKSEEGEEMEGSEDTPDDGVEDQDDVSDEQAKTAIAFLSLRKDVQKIASVATDALRDARKKALHLYK